DKVRKLADDNAKKQLKPTKGVHIILPKKNLNISHNIVIYSDDDRAMWISPKGADHIMFGTTDTDYDGPLDDVRATRQDVRYLLRNLNNSIEGADFTEDDIKSVKAKLRPLMNPEADISESSRSREHKVLGEKGLYSIIGGKLTTYRVMAEDIVEKAADYLKRVYAREIPESRTKTIPLLDNKYLDMPETISEDTNEYILKRYETEAVSIIYDYILEDEKMVERIVPDLPHIWADVRYAVEHEMSITLNDILMRRTEIFHLNEKQGLEVAEEAATYMAELIDEDASWVDKQVEDYKIEIEKNNSWRNEAEDLTDIKAKSRKDIKGFKPDWQSKEAEEGTYGAAAKYGAKDGFKSPNSGLYKFIKKRLNLADADFVEKRKTKAYEKIKLDDSKKVKLSAEQVEKFIKIVGKENVSSEDYDRVKHSYGQSTEEVLDLLSGNIGEIVDLVVQPRNEEDIRQIIEYCNEQKIPVYVYGGGTSVTLGLRPDKGGISLNMRKHMKKVLKFNKEDQTITVQTGMSGPELEHALNNALEYLGVDEEYTCGHFPQSFEYSTVGGWIAAMGSGQESSYYGDAYDIVLSQKYITPTGEFKTVELPFSALGPRMNDIMKGSEGAFGVMVSATLKVFKKTEGRNFAFIFPNWAASVAATRDMSQLEAGMPAMLRISDAEETDAAMAKYYLEGVMDKAKIEKILGGYKPGERSLCIGMTKGEEGLSENVKKKMQEIAKKHGGRYITGLPTKMWEGSRYTDPYLRESLDEFGVVIDTLETTVSWSNLHKVHRQVREYIKDRPDTICLSHSSHFYSQGTNLYFIFMTKMDDVEEYRKFQRGIVDEIEAAGGTVSHHHGIGKMLKSNFVSVMGRFQMGILRALKRYFDPNNIMNPGVLGLDVPEENIEELQYEEDLSEAFDVHVPKVVEEEKRPGWLKRIFGKKDKKEKPIAPDYWKELPEDGTLRKVFKYGEGFKHPNKRLLEYVKRVLGMTNKDFMKKQFEGLEKVKVDKPVGLKAEQLKEFIKIVGKKNVSTKDFDRLKFSRGQTTEEALELRRGIIDDEICDAVVHPRSKEDIQKIMKYCDDQRIPIYVYSGGTSVTLGLKPVKGGISLAMSTHMNKRLEFSEEDQTITVQPGMTGPELEHILNYAPEILGTQERYTCGHFPQSFEYATVGGWIAAMGSGQESSYYGDAYDIVLSQEYVTPNGIFKTVDMPMSAMGPRINDIMKGAEGAFGVMTGAKLKVFKKTEGRNFGFIFPNFKASVAATNEMSQLEAGMPAMLRISDAEETDAAMAKFGIEGTPVDALIKKSGYKSGSRSLCIGMAKGEEGLTKNVKAKMKEIAKKHGGMYITGLPTKLWEHSRFSDSYLREDFNDYGIVIDTLETTVSWSNLHKVHQQVREYIKDRPDTICLSHSSHFYSQGTNLYFIFMTKMDDVEEYRAFQRGIIDEIEAAGGSISHHHGIGKMAAKNMVRVMGKEQMGILRALKRYFDPNNIMNPGGTLGLDYDIDEEEDMSAEAQEIIEAITISGKDPDSDSTTIEVMPRMPLRQALNISIPGLVRRLVFSSAIGIPILMVFGVGLISSIIIVWLSVLTGLGLNYVKGKVKGIEYKMMDALYLVKWIMPTAFWFKDVPESDRKELKRNAWLFLVMKTLGNRFIT
ncbi:FAD-dependent oxidoreductase, partial [Elusimicrobiota bacterium]